MGRVYSSTANSGIDFHDAALRLRVVHVGERVKLQSLAKAPTKMYPFGGAGGQQLEVIPLVARYAARQQNCMGFRISLQEPHHLAGVHKGQGIVG